MARLAFRRAVSEKVANQSLRVVKDFDVSEPRTKQMAGALAALKVKGKALIVLDKLGRNAVLSSRNLRNVEIVSAAEVDTFQMMRYPTVIVSRPALAVIETRLRRGVGRRAR